jgi:hypothetical protein
LARDVHGQARAQMLQTMWALRYRDFPRRAALSIGHGARNGRIGAAAGGLAVGARDSFRHRRYRERLPDELLTILRRMERERIRQAYTLTVEDLVRVLPSLPSEGGAHAMRAAAV